MFEKIKTDQNGQQALTVLVSWLVFYLWDTDVSNYISSLDPETCFKDLIPFVLILKKDPSLIEFYEKHHNEMIKNG